MSRGINLKLTKDIEKLSPESRDVVNEVNKIYDEITDDIFDFESENRVRKAGYLPSHAEEIAILMKSENIQIGQIFQYKTKNKVLTPFKTVVDAQLYMTALQDRLFEITTVSVEEEIVILKKSIQEFKSLTFFDLIKLAFKRLYNNLFKRG